MRLTRVLWQQRQPMIKFMGKRSIPKQIDHSPHAHPASPEGSLPESFASYRDRAIQHGPLRGQQQQQQRQQQQTGSSGETGTGAAAVSPMQPYGRIGGHSAKELGPIQLKSGEVRDRNELPARFRRQAWSLAEIEAVESGGASAFG